MRRRYGRHPAVQRAAASLGQRGARRGAGSRIGLVDMGLQAGVPDLRSARIEWRHFGDAALASGALVEHGTHAASLLVAQGHLVLRGLVPAGRLAVALVGRADGTAGHAQVAGSNSRAEIRRGQAWYVSPDELALSITGDVELFVARTGR
jgi:hypothetical protein